MASEQLYQFVYSSKISVQGLLDRQTLSNIREESRVFNPKHHITGVLCYANFNFFQCVEGSKADLLILKELLEQDPRHFAIKVLDFSPIEQRRFRFWVMQALVMEKWYMNDDRFDESIPFPKLIQQPDGWRMALEHLAQMDATTNAENFDVITLTQSNVAYKLQKMVAEHQVFLLVQTLLGLLLMISLGFLGWEFF